LELKREKALARLEAEEAEERENERTERTERTARAEQHQTRVVPQRQATLPVKAKNPNVYEFMHDGEPAYVKMQKRGDSFIERLMSQAAMRKQ